MTHAALPTPLSSSEIRRQSAWRPPSALGLAPSQATALATQPERRLRLERVDPRELTDSESDQLYAFSRRFADISRRSFETGLQRCDELTRFHATQSGALVAFVTLTALEVGSGRTAATLLYTHWAIVEPSYRERGLIRRVLVRAYLRERLAQPLRRLFWLNATPALWPHAPMARSVLEAVYQARIADEEEADAPMSLSPLRLLSCLALSA